VDGPRLTLAVNHLIQNGIRFTPDGGKVRIRGMPRRDTLVLEVVDTGIGIDPERANRLLGRSFLSRDTLKHHSSRELEFNSSGLGLGLPIALGVVRAHGGILEIDRLPGGGSCFRIQIPEALPASDERPAA
jgi:two-component system OmpR family sensor kinase